MSVHYSDLLYEEVTLYTYLNDFSGFLNSHAVIANNIGIIHHL